MTQAAKLYEAIAYRGCLTDAGFGGACVALVAAGKVEAIAQDMLE